MEKIIDILPQMVNSLGIQKKYKIQLILFYWDKIVGEDIAVQSVPVQVEYGVLFIAVQNSVWCHHLSMMKVDLILKINQFVGEALIRDIRFKNNSFGVKKPEILDTEDEPNLSMQLKTVQLDNQELQRIGEECGKIKEETLKNRISRLYQKHLKFNKLKQIEKWHKCEGCDALCPANQRHCNVCAIGARHGNLSQIRKALQEVPWASYAEINQYIPCTSQEYIDAKVALLHRIAGTLVKGDEESMKAKILTMLFTGAKHDKLTARLIQKTLAKFRRNTYVSTFRR